jgi:hypothetical protein
MRCHSRGVEDAFGTVLIAIAVVAAVVACLSFLGSGAIYRGLGRTGLSLDEPNLRPSPQPGSAAWEAEANAELREEVRGLVIASNERRVRRGEAPLDVEREVERRLGELGA